MKDKVDRYNQKCEFGTCKNKSTCMNQHYHKDKWYCSFHSKREVKKGRILKRLQNAKRIKP